MIKPVYFRGKVVGDIVKTTYVTFRKQIHFMRIFQGFGISLEVLKHLEKEGVKDIKIIFHKPKGVEEKFFPLEDYMNSEIERKDDDDDMQKFVKFNSTTTREVKTTMSTLKESAMVFEPTQTMNISDLDKVPLDAELRNAEKTNSEGKEFSYSYIEFNGVEYRIPNSVIEQVQTIIKLKPETKFVKVTRTGSGLATKYKTEPII